MYGVSYEIRTFSFQVTGVDYTEDCVKVTTKSGEVIKGSKVILTLPLALLQQNHVTFNPPLPESKVKVINSLGAGIIEKVRQWMII